MSKYFWLLVAVPLLLSVHVGCSDRLDQPLAIANGNRLVIADLADGRRHQTINRYQEVLQLAYRPDGQRLAIAECFRNRVIELDAANAYAELSVPMQADSCPWDLAYSPDADSLAANLPIRPTSAGSLFGHLRIVNSNPLDRELGRPLPALAYRPGGKELAVATPTGLQIFSTTGSYPTLHEKPSVASISLAYTTDGSRLIAGTENGYVVLNAAAGYVDLQTHSGDEIIRVAVAPSGGWIAMVSLTKVSLLRSADLVQVHEISADSGFADAVFSADGSILAVAEVADRVRRFCLADWSELRAISVGGRIDALACSPLGQRLPVLFVHGHSGNSAVSWFDPGQGLAQDSMATTLATNPQLNLDAFYLELPLHGDGHEENRDRGIEMDAQDILAVIEGGLDSQGRDQVGILNLPAYRDHGRIAIIAFSQGTISSRYYLKNLMGTRMDDAITVSEFVALAAPNHGAGGLLVCRNRNEPDKARRQLCGGLSATISSQIAPCGNCPDGQPPPFTTNEQGDATFLIELNGHAFSDSCDVDFSQPEEAPHSRPPTSSSYLDGVLYVNLYAAHNEDTLVGGHTQAGDCAGRRLARNHAPDAVNMEITDTPGIPVIVHSNFPHHWPTICVALRTVAEHAAPASQQDALQGMVQP